MTDRDHKRSKILLITLILLLLGLFVAFLLQQYRAARNRHPRSQSTSSLSQHTPFSVLFERRFEAEGGPEIWNGRL